MARREQWIARSVQLANSRDFPGALAAGESALALGREIFGADHDEAIQGLDWLARLSDGAGDANRAEGYRREIVAVQERRFGKEDWRAVDARQELEDGRKLARMPVDDRAALAEARRLNHQVQQQLGSGQVTDALPLALRAVALRERALGAGHPLVARDRSNLANVYLEQGDYRRAKESFAQVALLVKQSKGERHPDYAWAVAHVALSEKQLGDYAAALKSYEAAVRAFRTLKGVNYLLCLHNQASLLHDLGNPERARLIYADVLAQAERAPEENQDSLSTYLTSLGTACRDLGDYDEAERRFKQALSAAEARWGTESSSYESALNNLAELYQELGDYAQADRSYRACIEISRKRAGEEHPDYARAIANLAALQHEQGDYGKAEANLKQALEIKRRTLGDTHPQYAHTLRNLGAQYVKLEAYDKALPCVQQARQIFERALGPQNAEVAGCVEALGSIAFYLGDYAEAKKASEYCLQFSDLTVGARHPQRARRLRNLAACCEALGEHREAEQHLRAALQLLADTLGRNHPDVAEVLNYLGGVKRDNGQFNEAEPLSREALEVTLARAERLALARSETQQLADSQESRFYVANYLTLAFQAGEYHRSAFDLLLRWKGQMAQRQRLLRAAGDHPRQAALFERLRKTTSLASSLALTRPDPTQQQEWRTRLQSLLDEQESLEQQLARDGADLSTLRSHPTAPQIQSALAQDAALVDLWEFAFRIHEPETKFRARWESRLAAFVITRQRGVQLLDLGPSRVIGDAITAWRGADGKDLGTTPAARQAAEILRSKLWEPIEKELSGVTTVYISPDGELAKLPFAALPGRTKGSYLVHDYTLSLLPVPASLALPTDERRAGVEGLLAIGGVDYNEAEPEFLGTVAARGTAAPRAPKGEDEKRWNSLPGAAGEVIEVEKIFRSIYPRAETKRLSGQTATEAAFRKEAPQYRHLVLATHGFFAPKEVKSALGRSLAPRGPKGFVTDQSIGGYHPDLLSGVVLAGANQPLGEGDDGILTAMEVRALDLRGTELVTLSACETGLGATAGGEGVLGLQRAFHIAGAKTVVASLWKVPDGATQSLMERFYKNLWHRKQPPATALRNAQLQMLTDYKLDPQRPGETRAGFVEREIREAEVDKQRRLGAQGGLLPPYFWAGFVLSTSGK